MQTPFFFFPLKGFVKDIKQQLFNILAAWDTNNGWGKQQAGQTT